ncbi:MAG: 1,4-dihydroxy-6-naphthoate synthase [Capsulimonadales bacterium]|nr:1,4-dihydroxy-6-naphthoate synthase [Capsulimonadales bacterium]
MSALTIGISPCPNDVYIFSGLILGHVEWDGPTLRFDFEDVETCNQRVLRGEFDIAKISYGALARVTDRYVPLDCGGALGRGVGPLLLRNGEARFDPEEEVLVPGEMTTANFLLDFFAGRVLKKRYTTFDEVYRELCNRPGTQGVVIHEKRFTFERDGLTRLQDLGEHWEQETGAPIPLGVIVLRRELIRVRAALETAIRNSLSWADSHTKAALELCREHAQEMSDEVMLAHIRLYVNEFSRDSGVEGRRAVAAFLEQQAEQARRLNAEATRQGRGIRSTE